MIPTWPTRALLAVFAAAVLAACGSGPGAEETAIAGADRVVALGEEFLLADLLALGVVPVASTATVHQAGFQGIDPSLTEGIVALPSTEPNLERLAALEPDVLVATPFVLDALGAERVAGLARRVVVVDEDEPRDALRQLAQAFDARERAEALIAELDLAIEEARAAVTAAGPISVATVYPGPSLAAWVDGPSTVPAVLLESGATLLPGPGVISSAGGGRAYLDPEQVGQLTGDWLVLLQSALVDGEQDALETQQASQLWQQLPAVGADQVVVLDRLGYPGIEGRTRAARDLAGALGR